MWRFSILDTTCCQTHTQTHRKSASCRVGHPLLFPPFLLSQLGSFAVTSLAGYQRTVAYKPNKPLCVSQFFLFFLKKAIQEHKRARMGLCMRVNKVSELWKRHKPQRSKLFLVSCRDTPFAVSQAHIAHTFYEKLEQNVKCGTDTDTIFPRMRFSFECVSFPRPVHRIIVPILTSQRIKAVKGCKNSHILYKVIYSIVTYIQI